VGQKNRRQDARGRMRHETVAFNGYTGEVGTWMVQGDRALFVVERQ
jgi:hypothetical protein